MSLYQVGMVVGSLRKESYNRQLAQAIMKMLPDDFSAEIIEIAALPLYDQDLDGKQADSVNQFKAHIAAKQAIIFVSPEYNRSIPGVLKNALDQGSRPYGKNVWNGKPAGVIGASMGAIGTALAQQHLRNVITYLDMPTLTQPEAFIHWQEGVTVDAQGQLTERTAIFVQKWVDAYVAWVRKQLS